jgi:uncharacterized lipoprotein YddW (UPF0748 family)
MKTFFTILFSAFILSAFAQSPKYEFRAVWVATVENIDWPSSRKLTTDQQKAEFIKMLDMHKRNGMNAIMMQIRPVSDAFYPSQYEPWSEYLNGKQGLPPQPYYDPLQFMITETHKRGMEFHAWINPYRAVFNVKRSSVAPSHITRIKPDWFFTYGTTKYFDPGIPDGQQFVVNVVRDIVKRYEIDAIHMDDYFYPYKIGTQDFPDENSYRKYGKGLTKDDWRRSNTDSIIKHLREAILETNPSVKFGISPFGVWRNQSKDPRGSDSKAGVTNYDDLYADILLWLEKGWIDYVTPQLYREMYDRLIAFDKLTDWWGANAYGKHVYIGHGIYRAWENSVNSKGWKNPNEIPLEINHLRKNPNVQGSVYFSSKSFEKNPNGWNDSLQNNYYAKPAIVPPMPWVDTTKPSRPVVNNAKIKYDVNTVTLAFKNTKSDVRNYAVYYSPENNINIEDTRFLLAIVPAEMVEQTQIVLPSQKIKANRYLKVTAISKNNVESSPEELVLFK